MPLRTVEIVSEYHFVEFCQKYESFTGVGETPADSTPYDIDGSASDYWIDPNTHTCGYTIEGGGSNSDIEYEWKCTQGERQYTTDYEAYQVFVGQITPQEFVSPFGSINLAIDNLIANWQFQEPVPSWLYSALFRYVEDRLEEL